MTSSRAPATATTRFLGQAEDSTRLAMGAKIQVWGGPETGKSHDAYENLPRPLIVVDADVSAGLFNDDRFEGFKRLGLDLIPDIETLVAFLDEFTSRPQWYENYRSVLIDSLTQYIDPKVAALGIDNSSAAAAANVHALQGSSRSRAIADQGRAQANWARIAKELTRLIRKVSALGVHIYVIAEERTKFVGSRPGEGEDAAKSSLSPRKFTHAFDLIMHKVARDQVTISKSRFHGWTRGQHITGYRASRDLAPLLSAAVHRSSGMDDFDPSSSAHEELMDLLRSLGSDTRGGCIPMATMREYLATARNNDLSASEVRKIVNAVRRSYGNGAPVVPGISAGEKGD